MNLPATVIAVDVGGTKILGAAFDNTGEVARLEVATPRADDGRGDPGGEATLGVIDRLADARTVAGVCVGVPEYVHAGAITSEEVLSWPPATVADIERRISVPLVWASDVRCGALGEWSARDDDDNGDPSDARGNMLFVSLGTGISHTLVVDGAPIEGDHGEAIALGELRPGYGRASVEEYSSGRAVLDRWNATHGPTDPATLFNPAPGSAQAGFLEEPAELLGWAIAQVALALDPGLVVLGGGLGSRDTLYRRLIADAAARFSTRREIVVSTSVAGRDAGLLGAAHIARSLAPE